MSQDMLDRYTKAAALVPQQLGALMRNRWVEPHWTGAGDSFWYRRDRDDHGHEFVLIDPESPDRRDPLFDHEALATRLSRLLACELDPHQLPITGYERDPAGRVRMTLTDGQTLRAEQPERELGIETGIGAAPRGAVLTSPDGAKELFCREHDLWLRDIATGAEQALTSGGEPYYAWAALPDNNLVHIPMQRSGRMMPPAFTSFSPSGRIVVTARVDERCRRLALRGTPASRPGSAAAPPHPRDPRRRAAQRRAAAGRDRPGDPARPSRSPATVICSAGCS